MKNNPARNNSEVIKEAYEKSGLSYKKLAALVGVSVNTLSCWIIGRRKPPDYVTDVIVEKVDNYINGGGEYINKDLCRDSFAKTVYRVFETVEPQKQATAIMKAFDKLPTSSFKKPK